MEISEITIRKFKGIEEVTMRPIRPINVLIGRNNSGKTSVLACLQLLNKYFMRLASAEWNQSNVTIEVPDESFRKDTGENSYFEISVTIKQTRDERETQFKKVVESWNTRYNAPQMDEKKVKIQLDRDLFARMTFDFRGVRGKTKSNFGLTSIATVESEGVSIIAQGPSPGGQLRGLSLLHLFVHGRYGWPEFDSVSKLAKDNKVNEGIGINLMKERLEGTEDHRERCGTELLNPAFDHVKNAFQSAFMVSPYRHGETIMAAQRCETLGENGANLVNYLHDLHLNNYEAFKKVADFVEGIAPDVGRLHPRFVKKEGSELELAYEWPDSRVVNLANMGGGVEQLLILGCILLQQKTSFVLWEEPESHLHPGAQDILLSELEERIGDSRVFMTTHSPVFIRSSDKVAIHIMTNKDGKSGVGRTLSADELQEAATVLGSRPGHLVQADIVVYVEGKTAAVIFEEWLKKWPEREKILGHLLLIFYDCNPDSMGTEDYDLSKLKKITTNMMVFVDKDNDPGSDEPKEPRKKLRAMCEKFGIPYKNTDKRQIEDYFTEEAVRKALPTNIGKGWNYDSSKPMGEQLPTKKYNRAIAATMKWEDVEKNKDIMQVFAKIEEYAKKLKPETNVG